MAMHDANFSDHFDGGDKMTGFTVAKNKRLGLGVRRKTREAIMSNSPPLIKKRSRKLKRLIPIGKEVGGYKKARKHPYRHRGLKKIRSLGEKSKVKESESGKTHNKEQVKPCGSKTGPYEDGDSLDHLSSEDASKSRVSKLIHVVEKSSESETKSFDEFFDKALANSPYPDLDSESFIRELLACKKCGYI